MFAKTSSSKPKEDKANLIQSSTELQATGHKNYETIGPDQSNHCHSATENDTKVDTNARKKLLVASALCLVFMTGEIIGGALANSLAIMTDAAHLLTDFASFMISLLAIYLAARPATKSMSFGWHRAEVVGALISVLLIWVVTGVLFYLAVERVVQRNFEVDGKIMLITSSVWVVVNMIMAVTLHQHGHTHGGGGGSSHSHGGGGSGAGSGAGADRDSSAAQTPTHTQATSGASTPVSGASAGGASAERGEAKKGGDEEEHGHSHNLNVRAAFVHVIGDLIQSVGVMIAAIVIYIEPNYKLADPICTFIFSVLVLFTTITILKDAMNILMEGTPQGIDFAQVAATLNDIEGVKDVHSLRMWSLTTSRTALSAHLAVDPAFAARGQKILREARRRIRHQYKISEVTIQLEEYDEEMARCHLCKHPEE